MEAQGAPSGRWWDIERHAVVDSTQDVALARLRAGARPGFVVVADAQRAGRGRRGRTWRDDVSGPHGPANLAVTATLALPPRAPEFVPFVAGLAVAAAYEQAGASPTVKWPNDVLLDACKAAGILVERHHLDVGVVLLVGCGLDLDWRGVERSGEAAGWTSLAESVGRSVDRASILAALLAALDAGLRELEEDPGRLLARYRASCATIGQAVEVRLPDDRVHRGVARDVDEAGHLVVATDAGPVMVTAGDVVHVRAR